MGLVQGTEAPLSSLMASDFSGLNHTAREQAWLAEDLPAPSTMHPVSVEGAGWSSASYVCFHAV